MKKTLISVSIAYLEKLFCDFVNEVLQLRIKFELRNDANGILTNNKYLTHEMNVSMYDVTRIAGVHS